MRRKRVGLLGCGSIGTRIAAAIDSGQVPASLDYVFDSSAEAAGLLVSKLKSRPEIARNAHLLSSNPVDIVVEAASQDAVRDVALSVLQNRRDLLVMSVGALLDESVYDVLSEACADFGRSVILPSGAVAGLDGIRSVRGELEYVTLTTTKHPRSLRGAKFFEESGTDPDKISSRQVIFDGTAQDAVAMFPANVNVAALLSLSGLGGKGTRVRVVADPAAQRNTHRIEAGGGFGRMDFQIENVPDEDNPLTSRLASLSAIRALQEYCGGGVRVGT